MIPKAPFLSNILWFSVKYLLIQANALDWEPQSKRDQQSPWSPSPMMGFGGSAEFESRTSVITQKSFGLAGSPGLKHFSWSKRITHSPLKPSQGQELTSYISGTMALPAPHYAWISTGPKMI